MHVTDGAPRLVLITAGLLVLGAFGGWLATHGGLPMPWMLGSLLASGVMVTGLRPAALDDYRFPMRFRTFFVGLIGVMIGSQVSSDFLAMAAQLPLTMAMLALFVVLAHGGNMLIFRRVGGYDRPTAFYSGTPGGLMESILLGEAAGADARILTAQQFLRIIFVITLLPLGLSLWLGHPVGSAAGLAPGGASAPVTPGALVAIVLTALAGLGLARVIHLPAGQLTGPLLLAAALSVAGHLDLHLPFWMISGAQVVIGVSLGLRFQGMDGRLLRKSAWLCAISVVFMLLLGGIMAAILHRVTGLAFLHLLISFAPGGVTEMSVIALSLAANPALVSLHHVARILMTVVELSLASKWLGLRG
ncbi:AbrB family transcriptional regulator [Tropicibacter oceani]|uniref:AbrB family transcriptional regulator n=1 Tax=Tropicibacter oceani TaxID=3058420 RepID=A0ABY8QEZ9_9RHOB|nr:AbrB family transcriptional regulator [Tropicibacter oceani]WGW02762.1 AbrB family transcriptional regulator [Tropicibacter oceani]